MVCASPDHQLFHPERADEYVTITRLGVNRLADALRRVAGPQARTPLVGRPFNAALNGRPTNGETAHLTPDALHRAQRHLVAKAIAEFSHERLLATAGPERARQAS